MENSFYEVILTSKEREIIISQVKDLELIKRLKALTPFLKLK